MISCASLRQQMDDDRDRELPAADMRLVRAHLGECPACAAVHRTQSHFLDLIREHLRAVSAPAHLRATLQARLRELSRDTAHYAGH